MLCALGGYQEIRTPVFEHTELFLRGVGDTTDIVQKEMYTFLDKGDRSVTLKPEGTAGVVRAFVEHGLAFASQPTKMYYLSAPIFRYENPQAGRLREHHQFGVEVFGASRASIDAEVMQLALTLFETLGVRGLKLHINSIGCPQCRPAYNELLGRFIHSERESLCANCLVRLEKNPLRILDCKEEKCRKIVSNAPLIADNLCAGCAAHFEELKQYLKALHIPYTVDPFIVRGLDYYTKTVFEVISTEIGSQGTVCGGGRYDRLVAELGGPDMPGIGFGLGMERLLLLLSNQGLGAAEQPLYDVFFCTMGEAARKKAFVLMADLRTAGIRADMDHNGRSMKAQFKLADKCGASWAAVIGEDEIKAGAATMRNMRGGDEHSIDFLKIIDWLRQEKKNG